MQTFLFYDIETTGLNKAFDQVLHFAGIRTDRHLNELERYELKIKLNPDMIPSPYAMIIHQMNLQDIAQGQSEFDAIKQIHQWLNQPGTTSLGYNTLGFDDEFLRFSFYRNLLSPYTHQFANECGRMDLYPMTVMYFLYKNQVLKWPQREGITSLKLEQLNAINQLAVGRAHDAMVDVVATLGLAQRFFQERDMWEYLIGYFNKQTDQTRLQNLSTALLVDGFLGATQFYQCPALFLGMHRHYKNQLLWLRLDSTELSKTTPETLTETTRVIHKKLSEPSFILPMKERFLQHLTQERRELAEFNHQWLQQNPPMLAAIADHYAEYKYPVHPTTDIEASLYLNGFWTSAEQDFCRAFHRALPNEKAKLTQQLNNSKLQTLALRILGRNYPESLTPEQSEQFAEHMRKVSAKNSADALIDYQGRKRLTPEAAALEVQELNNKGSLSTQQLTLLGELSTYLQEKFFLQHPVT